MLLTKQLAAFAAACALSFSVQAKPIAYGKGTTLIAEYGAGTMNEVQAFYAPHYWYSLGGAWLSLRAESAYLWSAAVICTGTGVLFAFVLPEL